MEKTSIASSGTAEVKCVTVELTTSHAPIAVSAVSKGALAISLGRAVVTAENILTSTMVEEVVLREKTMCHPKKVQIFVQSER